MLTVPLAAFVAFVLVSTAVERRHRRGGDEGVVLLLLPFVLLYALVVAWWPRARALAALADHDDRRRRDRARWSRLYQYATQDIWWNETLQQANVYSRFFRVNGIFFDPNILGRYLALAILAVPGPRLGAARGRWSCRPGRRGRR